VELVGPDDVLLSFQRPALEAAHAFRPSLRTVQHVGYGVSVRRAQNAWAVGFSDSRVARRGIETALPGSSSRSSTR